MARNMARGRAGLEEEGEEEEEKEEEEEEGGGGNDCVERHFLAQGRGQVNRRDYNYLARWGQQRHQEG